ncbi:MAG: ribbon-helix-helix domain-containing protein [Promethearchaeia archaeon]
MKIITANVPDSYIKLIEEISSRTCASRSELLRLAIKQFLLKEMGLAQKLEKELERIKDTYIFDYCINCERKLENLPGNNHKFHQNYEILGLKFCFSCYKKFKDKSFCEFPEYLINRIRRELIAYKDHIEKFNFKKLSRKKILLIQKLEKELGKLKIFNFFDYCINCEKKLDSLEGKNHKFHKNFEVFELKFCCSCYKKFKDKSFDEFPAYLIKKIKKKVKEYNDYIEKSNQSNTSRTLL